MNADTYQDLYEFNSAIQAALRALNSITRNRSFAKRKSACSLSFLREVRSATNSYIVGVIETCETDEAGTLFKRRRKRERRDDSSA